MDRETYDPEVEELRRSLSLANESCGEWRELYEAAETKLERAEDSAHRLHQWCEAYPLDVFPEPTKAEWKQAHQALKDAGLSGIDRFSASNMRHVVNGVADIANELLSALKTGEQNS